jgi:GNAT superfamily N-acetyltransferase
MLFVDPSAIGQGIGAALIAHLLDRARPLGFTVLTIDADPNAEAFYLARGAVRTGVIPSGSVPGRVLPRLELSLAPSAPR